MMRRLDRAGALRFVDVASEENFALPLDRATLLGRLHASEDGKILSGAAAFAAMWRAIPLLRPLGAAARLPWVLKFLEVAYRTFLQFRPHLQRLVAGGRTS